MELKCAFCGKIYNDPDKYTECVMRCRELQQAREDQAKREESAKKEKELREKIKHHYDEWVKYTSELYDTYPDEKNKVFEILWPNFDARSIEDLVDRLSSKCWKLI